MTTKRIKQRLGYLRSQINAESISYDEIVELQSLAGHIEKEDIVLLEWAGVPEHSDPEPWDPFSLTLGHLMISNDTTINRNAQSIWKVIQRCDHSEPGSAGLCLYCFKPIETNTASPPR